MKYVPVVAFVFLLMVLITQQNHQKQPGVLVEQTSSARVATGPLEDVLADYRAGLATQDQLDKATRERVNKYMDGSERNVQTIHLLEEVRILLAGKTTDADLDAFDAINLAINNWQHGFIDKDQLPVHPDLVQGK